MKKIRLDIGGPKGNAFFVLGTADKLARQMGYDEGARKDLRNEMTGATIVALGGKGTDYNHLLQTFKKHFPFVEMYAQHDIGIDSDLYVIDKSDVLEL